MERLATVLVRKPIAENVDVREIGKARDLRSLANAVALPIGGTGLSLLSPISAPHIASISAEIPRRTIYRYSAAAITAHPVFACEKANMNPETMLVIGFPEA